MDNLLAHLLLEATSRAGTVDPDECLLYVEESMTGEEYDLAESFLKWCHTNDRQFGHGNILSVYEEFKKED